MKLWKRNLTALLLCLSLLAGLITGAAAMTPVETVDNGATHLRTSYSDSNYLDLSISGDTLTVTGKLLASGLQQVNIQVSSASCTVDAEDGQLFSAQLHLSHSGSAVVKINTKQSGSSQHTEMNRHHKKFIMQMWKTSYM